MSTIEFLHSVNPSNIYFDKITLGTVIDTNDPQQMGRIRARCPAWGDSDDKLVKDIPWARYMTPFGGSMQNIQRGPEGITSLGPVAYGMWNIPKVNTQVIVACLDGDPDLRIWLGCVYGQFLTSTMPHGRHLLNREGTGANGSPEAPLSATEDLIRPLFVNYRTMFTPTGKTTQGKEAFFNFEWPSRGADYQVSAINSEQRENFGIENNTDADDLDVGNTFNKPSNTRVRQGYQVNRWNPTLKSDVTGPVFDSQTYSWVTPGFHAISMDDRAENGRIRIRTTKGHQIIFDDTNERIYISTAQGNNWIELDEKGNIDIYASRRLSVHAEKDINFTTDETFRVKAKHGIHLISEGELRVDVQGKETAKGRGDKGDMHFRVKNNTRIHTEKETFIESDKNMHLFTTEQLFAHSDKSMHLDTAEQFRAHSGGSMHHLSGANMRFNSISGPRIDLNGPPASRAAIATKSFEKPAFWTNRLPEHEPWGRVLMDPIENLTHSTVQFPYDSDNINQVEKEINGETDLNRGSHWRR